MISIPRKIVMYKQTSNCPFSRAKHFSYKR